MAAREGAGRTGPDRSAGDRPRGHRAGRGPEGSGGRSGRAAGLDGHGAHCPVLVPLPAKGMPLTAT